MILAMHDWSRLTYLHAIENHDILGGSLLCAVAKPAGLMLDVCWHILLACSVGTGAFRAPLCSQRVGKPVPAGGHALTCVGTIQVEGKLRGAAILVGLLLVHHLHM